MAAINQLLSDPDRVEQVRDVIGVILQEELANQQLLAASAGLPDMRDYRVLVMVDNERPYNLNGDRNPFPVVNVMIGDDVFDKGGGRINNFGAKAEYHIFCHACGNYSREGNLNDTQTANRKVWKLARLVRNILSAGPYTYLGLRGIVSHRQVMRMHPVVMNVGDSALAVSTVLVHLSVSFEETSPQSAEGVLEEIHGEFVQYPVEAEAPAGGGVIF